MDVDMDPMDGIACSGNCRNRKPDVAGIRIESAGSGNTRNYIPIGYQND